jgi:hypothetical protein
MLANLSQNEETHKKIVDSSGLLSISILINENINYETTYYGILVLSHLS